MRVHRAIFRISGANTYSLRFRYFTNPIYVYLFTIVSVRSNDNVLSATNRDDVCSVHLHQLAIERRFAPLG